MLTHIDGIHYEDREKVEICEAKREASKEAPWAGTLISDSRIVRK